MKSAGLTDSRDVTIATPGLRVEATGIHIQPSIRGITSTLAAPRADPNVATYDDGVYQTSPLSAICTLPYVEQIEVLKGPKVTLLGRNATGGAILIASRPPDLTAVTGKVEGSYGRFNSASVGGFMSVPLVNDQLAISLTSLYSQRDDRNPAIPRVIIASGPYDFASDADSYANSRNYSADPIGIVRPDVGAFFYWNSSGYAALGVNNYVQATYSRDEAVAQAAFGELTWSLSDAVSLVTGLRYSHEGRRAFAAITHETTALPAGLALLGRASFDAVTPRVSLTYRVNPDVNLYATYCRGFKSGTFNSARFQTTPVNPETVDAIEIGVKTNPMPGMRLHVTGFYYDYGDLQVNSIAQQEAAFSSTLQNAASARNYGVEIDGAWRISDAFRLSFGAFWLDAKYQAFPSASVNIPNPDGLGGNITMRRVASGRRRIRAADFSGNLSVTYGVPVGDGRIEATANMFYSARYDPLNRPSQPARSTSNTKIGWQPSERIELAVCSRNLKDVAVIASETSTALTDQAIYIPPRTCGVQASFAF